MHIAKLQEKKDKFNHGLGRLKKAYVMVPYPWIIITMGMVGLADSIIGLIKPKYEQMEKQLIYWSKTAPISAH